MNNYLIEIGKRIKDIREKSKKTISTVASAANVSTDLITQIENGSILPSLAVLMDILNALEIDAADFFGGMSKPPEETSEIPAYRLINNADGSSSFEKGTVPSLKHMNTASFWYSNKTEEWEKNAHPAPRKQYVITVKGKIKFRVSDGSTFIIEPGIILLAEDTKGEGHSWHSMDNTIWERLYIPIIENADDHFKPENL